jgi:subtilisin family serine protease
VGELGGTGKKIITAGSYATTNKFTNLSLVVQDYTNEVTLNDISTFSSRGATVDGRIKPDITAPGDFVAAAVNSYDPNYTATSDNVVAKVAIGGIDFFYAAEQGTSFSCPMVVGVVALMLEADRNLTPEQAKNIIQTTARQDNYTKTITSPGSNIWGWGKLNAYGAVYKTATGIADNSKASSINVYPIPASNELLIDQSNIQFSSAAYAHIIDMQGQVVAQFNYMDIKLGRLNVRQLNQGMYILQLVDGAFSATQKIIITH